ncbi:MAG: helix-turn-helix transcriptional regulator [Renibacterium sp.]|nr:helix-turn-helix transcriptional regulator [Renibacterium sp.]
MRDSIAKAIEICPVEVAIGMIGGAWKLTALSILLEKGTMRFGELRRAVGDVNERSLARQLRELEADGLISREVFAQVPPKVEYSLTHWGEELAPAIQALESWSSRWIAQAQAEEAASA